MFCFHTTEFKILEAQIQISIHIGRTDYLKNPKIKNDFNLKQIDILNRFVGMNGHEFKTSRRLALKIISTAIVALTGLLTARFTAFFVRRNQFKKIKIADLKRKIYVDQNVFIRKDNAGNWQVFSRTCPHLGCKVKFDQQNQRFICPCHGSQFNLRGQYVKGPAKKDLTRLRFEQNKNQLTIFL